MQMLVIHYTLQKKKKKTRKTFFKEKNIKKIPSIGFSVADFVGKLKDQDKSPKQIAEELVDAALDRGSMDNVTAIGKYLIILNFNCCLQ